MAEIAISTNISIRGIGSGVNRAFEQSVGYFVDGVSYPRAQQSRAPFLDPERVEVLRGPQLILFGKNSIAGALNIATAKPTDAFEGYLSTTYEFGEHEIITEGAVTGPLASTQAARIAGADLDVYSAFAQFNFRPFDKLELQVGGRVSQEKKSGSRTLPIEAEGGGALTGAQIAAPIVYANAFGITSTNRAALGPMGAFFISKLVVLPVSATRKEIRFSPDIKVVYEPSPDLLLYATWARGTKSGGFDFHANNHGVSPTIADAFVFEDERATNYEIGAKSTLLGGAAELNVYGFFYRVQGVANFHLRRRAGF